ncbi:diguanylate cyclase (GGDEF)-like protein [Deinococcus sp. HSC-46F16]|uniref:diguanylate cyclase domain-containing protein n=1 Tax=Deinococcus sp. HSC-46F16 TaxID=2910968 RepID=UPI0020A215BF|nr:diguanylate cyclase [Deinococcus sp. HSC-46F16]MCP2014606.1 diguanylate cyclase (GGDEF)-like protein [Deinococcus sp. HSC-46F16]
MSPILPTEEFARLEALSRYAILDDLPAEAFARLATLAAQFFRAPIALINFVAEDSTRCQACVGVDLRVLDRQVSFCSYTVMQPGVLVVPDLRSDDRFVDNPLVTAPGGYRFYAGAPLTTPSGHNIGTLCVLDTVPREEVSSAEREALHNLAALAIDELELRRVATELEREARARDRLVQELRRVTQHSETLLAVFELADLDLLPHELAEHAVALVAGVTDLDWAGLISTGGELEQARTVWQAPGLSPHVQEQLTRPPSREAGPSGETVLFLDHPTSLARARPDLAAAGVCVAAQVPLVTSGDQALSLLAVRTRPLAWAAADRVLLETVGRSVMAGVRRRAALDAAQREATFDALTGLPGRRAFERDLDARVAGGAPFVLVRCAFTDFAALNGALGHVEGDALLARCAEALGSGLTGGDQAYRLDGVHFALLLTAPAEGEREAAERQAREAPARALSAARDAGFELPGVSVGTALWPRDARSARALLHLASQRRQADERRNGSSAG